MPFTAVPSTNTNLEASLKRLYEPEYFDVHVNEEAPYYSMLLKGTNYEIEGEGLYWPFHMALSQNQGFLAAISAFPPVKPRLEVQARMRPVQLGSSFKVSFILKETGKSSKGAFGKSEVRRHIQDITTGATKHLNRVFAGAENTGRLGQIEANTTTSDTFVMKKPNGAWLIQPQMLLDVYTLPTGGAISTVANDATQLYVNSVNQLTRTVVVSETTSGTPASLSLVADEHVYAYPDYGNAPNGLLGLIDDGTYSTTIHNQSRTTYPILKSYVSSNSGTGRPLAEEMLEDMVAMIYQNSGKFIDKLLMNTGQLRQYNRFVKPQRRYDMSTDGTPGSFNTGTKGKPKFFFGGGFGDIETMVDITPGLVYGFNSKTIRRFETKKLDWLKGEEDNILKQAIGSSGRETAWEAHICAITNQGCLQPNANGVIRDLLEPQMLGEASE